MARARNIKPGLFKNEILGVADPLYTLLFEGLWLLADREGRLEDRPLRIKAEIFPYREGLDIEAMLNWLVSTGFITRYTAHGVKCIFIEEFVKHQNPHKNEPDSSLPAPEFAEPDTGISESNSDSIGTTSEKIGSAPADSLIPDSLIPDTSPPGEVGAKPKRSAKPKSEDHPQAVEVLDYLNAKAGRSYQPVKANLSMIGARLSEGASVADCKAVIDAKVAQWLNDAKMSEYLRPETLFNATKFASYVGGIASAGEPASDPAKPPPYVVVPPGARWIPGRGVAW